MKTKLIAVMLLAGSALFAETHFSIGVGVGGPAYYPPQPAVVVPPSPGPGYTWVDGYWNNGVWVDGYWAPPAYGYAAPPAYGYAAPPTYGYAAPPAYYAAPRYRIEHHDWDRGWDRHRDRDRDRDRDWDRDRYRDRGHEGDRGHDRGRR